MQIFCAIRNSIFLFGSASLLGFNQNPSLIACTCEIIRRTHVFLRCRLGDKACWKSRRPCRHDQIEREGRRTEEEWEGRGGGHQGQEPELLPSLLAPAPVAGTELAPVSRGIVSLEGDGSSGRFESADQ